MGTHSWTPATQFSGPGGPSRPGPRNHASPRDHKYTLPGYGPLNCLSFQAPLCPEGADGGAALVPDRGALLLRLLLPRVDRAAFLCTRARAPIPHWDVPKTMSHTCCGSPIIRFDPSSGFSTQRFTSSLPMISLLYRNDWLLHD